MSSRVFQSVIVQMKEATDRVIGVIDADSNVISCSDTSLIGEKWPEAVIRLNSAPDSIVVVDHKTFKPLVSWSAYFDYAVFAEGDDETARSLCVMAAAFAAVYHALYHIQHRALGRLRPAHGTAVDHGLKASQGQQPEGKRRLYQCRVFVQFCQSVQPVEQQPQQLRGGVFLPGHKLRQLRQIGRQGKAHQVLLQSCKQLLGVRRVQIVPVPSLIGSFPTTRTAGRPPPGGCFSAGHPGR